MIKPSRVKGGDSMESQYERHDQIRPEFPFIYHLDTAPLAPFSFHWHENVELLYFVQGKGTVYADRIHHPVEAGDLAVINSGNLHSVYTTEPPCLYYCLIMDKNFCDDNQVDVETRQFRPVVRDDKIGRIFRQLVAEMESRQLYYQSAVKAAAAQLLVELGRNWAESQDFGTPAGKKSAVVKAAIGFIRQHYKEPLTVDAIGSAIGFSKYYLCHVFKEVTGETLVEYIQYLRCNEARRLLASGEHNVGEAARLCGFQNLSYFSKIYRRYMGESPRNKK